MSNSHFPLIAQRFKPTPELVTRGETGRMRSRIVSLPPGITISGLGDPSRAAGSTSAGR